MSEEKNGQRDWYGVPEEEAVRRLLREAGKRPALPHQDLAAVQRTAREEWDRRYAARRNRRVSGSWWLALAAAALLGAIGLVWWRGRPETAVPGPASSVASIEVMTGDVRVEDPAGQPLRRVSADMLGQPVPAGSGLRTARPGEGEGRIALRMAGGASVRLDAGTTLRLASSEVVELREGAVYVDSGTGPGHRGVAVRTAAGLFQEQGTQFEVRMKGSGLDAMTRLRVREGRVLLDRGAGAALVTAAGDELTVRGNGEPVPASVPVSGPEWDWVLRTAPMPAIEGMKVRVFLDWLGRETGQRVRLADEKTAAVADSVVLHGSIRHLTPAEAPGVVLSSSGLGHRVSGDTLVVFVADPDDAGPR
jgi:hypothetical protein